ncbi:dihydrofolate reductase family protein [Agromyces sp. SYSU T00194]|uniref:dihydrofolate reductase family protein n=1 Tax=Agromyces chitinivorans TaxID=3158560 RepID=UPI00339926B6
MGTLVYATIASLDGYVNDAQGAFDWAEPPEDLVGSINDVLDDVGTYLYGRRMYDVMHVWETDPDFAGPGLPAETARFSAGWREADKVVFSSTLTEALTTRTRIEPAYDADLVRSIVADASGGVTIEGPTLAAHALRDGLVDEVHRYVAPAIVGGGTPVFVPGLRLDLELVEERRFARGFALLRYAVR